MTLKTYIGGYHSYTDAAAWTPTGAPIAGDTVYITSGAPTISDAIINQETILVFGSGTPDGLDLDNATIGATTTLTSISNSAAFNMIGTVLNRGVLNDGSGAQNINVGALGEPVTFINAGTVNASGSVGGTELTITAASGSQVENTGTFFATGNGYYAGGDLLMTGAGAFTNSGTMIADDGTITAPGQMTNSGVMETETSSVPDSSSENPGTVNIAFGQENGITFKNTGLLDNGLGSTFDISAAPGSQASVINSGDISNSGSMTIAVAVDQTGKGSINLFDGNLLLEDGVSGGTIYISKATLEFGGPTSPGFIGPASAKNFAASVDFDGPAGGLQFDNTSNLSEVLKGQNLLVYSDPTPQVAPIQLADIKLTGGSYTASSFHVVGDTINTSGLSKDLPGGGLPLRRNSADQEI